MFRTTTPSVEGHRFTACHAVVAGEAILGANVVRDLCAEITEIIGGRSGSCETSLKEARDRAMRVLAERAGAAGGNAVVGIGLDYEAVGNSMLMVSTSGTDVSLEKP